MSTLNALKTTSMLLEEKHQLLKIQLTWEAMSDIWVCTTLMTSRLLIFWERKDTFSESQASEVSPQLTRALGKAKISKVTWMKAIKCRCRPLGSQLCHQEMQFSRIQIPRKHSGEFVHPLVTWGSNLRISLELWTLISKESSEKMTSWIRYSKSPKTYCSQLRFWVLFSN